MKSYIIKPEFIDRFGSEANAMTIITESDVESFAREWEMNEEEILEQLIELNQTVRTPIHRFAGKHDWQELNELIRFDSGVQEPYCETEEEYKRAIHEGFITFDGYYTTVWED